MQLTTSQKRMVDKLLSAFFAKQNYKFASFKAPTGAGKTFMASEFISRVFLNELGNSKKTIFVVATISNAELPKQFFRKLNKYKKYHEFTNYKIEYIQSPSISTSKKQKIEDIDEFFLEDNKVFVFGTSSFGKNTLFYQNKTLDTFLQQAQELNYQIFFIRDEAHIGKKEKITKNDLKTFDEKMNDASKFIINMTATPRKKNNLIEMTASDMEDDGFYLLKTNMVKTELLDEISNEEIIDDAIKNFIKSKKEYHSLSSIIINPAMLIQVMNENDYDKDKIRNQLFHEELNLLEKKLQKNGLKYLKYLNNSPEVIGSNLPNTLEYASQIDSEIDVIIFKVGPATGWDIPRANMLLQLRNVSSETLNIQTIGRIMRNPHPNLEKQDITDKYYLWSNYQKPTRNEAFYRIKDKFVEEKFISGLINEKSRRIIDDNNSYVKDVLNFIRSPEFINHLKDFNVLNDVIYDQISYGSPIVKIKIPNHICLKIYNFNKRIELENTFKLSLFQNELIKTSKKEKLDIEIVWYVFLKFHLRISEIKINNSKWIYDYKPYEIIENVQPRKYYSLWKDNKEPKWVNTSDFKNYGYVQISDDEDIQFLDSMSEMKFYKNFFEVISKKQREEISFFAKMPTLGSQVYFEYYSKLKGVITKSYMDFAIKYKNKIIMIEVKSKDQDYNEEKTSELLNAYKIYMEKFYKKNISLILYQYDKASDTSYINGYINNKWEENLSFRDLFDELFI